MRKTDYLGNMGSQLVVLNQNLTEDDSGDLKTLSGNGKEQPTALS